MNKVDYVFDKLAAVFFRHGRNGDLSWLPDPAYISIAYFLKFRRFPRLSRPITFNEKLNWLKLHDRKPEYTVMVDKYRVRDYVAGKIGDEYLIPLLGMWEKAEDIDFDSLPDRFVLKCNHDSGSVIVCKDKSALDVSSVREKLAKCLKNNGFGYGREWVYKNIAPCIIAEKYMSNRDEPGPDEKARDFGAAQKTVSAGPASRAEQADGNEDEIFDYKFFCFNGKVKCFKIDFDRFKDHGANYYDTTDHLLDLGEVLCLPDYHRKLDMPVHLDKMICLAETLSQGMDFLRVDLYEIQGKIYFGELTFYPASGFGPFIHPENDRLLGDWIKLTHQ